MRALYLSDVLRRIPPSCCTHILDAGCAKGQMAFWLSRRLPEASIHGIDVNPSLIKHCRQLASLLNAQSVEFFEADLVSLQRKQTYDLITCIDVLEHILDWKSALRNLVRCTSPDGHILVHVPHESRYLGPSFGLRQILSGVPQDKSEHAPGGSHVRDGFRAEDFSILEKWNVCYTVKYTFGPLAMHLHTIFEVYRGRRRYWHLLMTPVLSSLAKIEVKRELRDGGGLLIHITK
jgi:SAM-dependent methyltransferase